MEKEKNRILDVELLGGFNLSYEGKNVVLGRSSTAKFIQLLQMVWLQGEKGITKENAVKSLYDRENVNNVNNSFNNLLYQLRLRMVRAGLPEGEYICRKEGVFVADDTVTLRIDALEFDRLIQLAEASEKEEEIYQYYSRAFQLYKGELLPGIASELWVTSCSFRYKEKFERCTLWLGNYLEKQKEYNEMYFIFSRAAEIYPFGDWQVHQMDALLHRGKYSETIELYDRTVRLYSEEMGLPPSEQMLKCYERMSRKITSLPNELEGIRRELNGKEKRRQESGMNAYYCSYPCFADVYHIFSQNMERTGQPICLMLCTLVDYEGKVIQNSEKRKARSEYLKQAIGQSLRRGDAYTRYSSSQYLILLVGTSQEDCVMIYRRIHRKFRELAGPRAEFSYYVTSLEELPEEQEKEE